MVPDNGDTRGNEPPDEEEDFLKIPEIFTTEYRKYLTKHYPVTCDICYLWLGGNECKHQYRYDQLSCRQHRKRKQLYRDEAQDTVFRELVILHKGCPPEEMSLLDFFPLHQNLTKSLDEKSKSNNKREEVKEPQMSAVKVIRENILKISKTLFRKTQDSENKQR
ncbi:MAG: hypothetical protein ACFFD4_30320 [Candidatus Odinarchaeota archaeon]